MSDTIIELILAAGALASALAIGLLCVMGLVVWLTGRHPGTHERHG